MNERMSRRFVVNISPSQIVTDRILQTGSSKRDVARLSEVRLIQLYYMFLYCALIKVPQWGVKRPRAETKASKFLILP